MERFTHKSQVLAKHCAEADTDFDAIVRSSNFFVVCEDTEADVDDRIRWLEDRLRSYVSDEEAKATAVGYRAMGGTPDQLIERLRPWVDAGMSYAICYFPDAAYDTSGLERFAKEVIPALA